jgi:hypothetical protein
MPFYRNVLLTLPLATVALTAATLLVPAAANAQTTTCSQYGTISNCFTVPPVPPVPQPIYLPPPPQQQPVYVPPPQPVYVPVPAPAPAVPAMPVPSVSANDRYSTSNGVKSAHDIQTELLAVGYSGPFDVPSLLAAYQRTTTSPVRPL